jgi:hypothetical protein
MQPSLGRIVIYRHEISGTELPAIITQVHSPDNVNLQVFSNGSGLQFKSSVKLGTKDGEWNWPVKVPTT